VTVLLTVYKSLRSIQPDCLDDSSQRFRRREKMASL